MFEQKKKKAAPVAAPQVKSKLKPIPVPQLPARMEGAEEAIDRIDGVLEEETQEEKKAAVIRHINRNMRMSAAERKAEETRCGCW